MKPCLMIGDGGALPFLGHARSCVEGSEARLWCASRLFAGGDVVAAYEASRTLCEVVETVSRRVSEVTDRNTLIRSVWEALAEVSPDSLGPRSGDDLQILLVAEDVAGQAVAGVGLSMVYGLTADGWSTLVSGDHPLLCGPGLPRTLPGVLTLDREVLRVVAIPDHLNASLPTDFDLRRDCGWQS